MRLLPLLLAAAAAPAFISPACAQAAAANSISPPSPERAARLKSLFAAADRGDVAALAGALASERDADMRVLLEARMAAMRLDPRTAADPRLLRLAAAGAPADIRAAALTILAAAAFSGGDYGRAATLGAELEPLQRAAGESAAAEATAQARALAALLADQPRQALQGAVVSGSSRARRDAAGLMRVDTKINGHAQDAVFDTGANLSVLSASTAKRLGVRLLDGAAGVGNSVRTTVPVRLGVADRFDIAGNVLRNVAFLVIDDTMLTFPAVGGYTIPAIIGFPVMRALGRFRVEPNRFAVEPARAAAAAGDGHNLHAWANELFVDARVGGVPIPLHLDSGATTSHLNAVFAQAHPAPLAGLPRERRRQAGAGGTATGEVVRWRNVPVEIGGQSFRTPEVPVAIPGSEVRPSPYMGKVGVDLLRSFGSYAVDLRAMRLELGAAPARARGR